MISRTAEYAVRAALWLAAHAGHSSSARRVATATAIPHGYLAKILQALAKAGIVHAQPGPGGGFVMRRRPADIHVLEVIDAVDPLRRITKCPLGVDDQRHCLCPLHTRLDGALAQMQRLFAECTLAELLAESNERGLVCNHDGERPNVAPPAHQNAPTARRTTNAVGESRCGRSDDSPNLKGNDL